MHQDRQQVPREAEWRLLPSACAGRRLNQITKAATPTVMVTMELGFCAIGVKTAQFPATPGSSSITTVPLSCRNTSCRAARSASVSTAVAAVSAPRRRLPSADSGGVRVGRCEPEGVTPCDLLLPLLVPLRALLGLPSGPIMAAADCARALPPAGGCTGARTPWRAKDQRACCRAGCARAPCIQTATAAELTRVPGSCCACCTEGVVSRVLLYDAPE